MEMIMSSYERVANDYLELASDQRLEILFQLQQQDSRITQMANKIGSTKQEVHRNFSRLLDSGLIAKNTDSGYYLTTYGNTICTQVPTLMFFADNKHYFEDHIFGDIPNKFIMRVGQLSNGHRIKGVTKVLEECKSIYNNAEEYVYEILAELSLERLSTLAAKTKGDVKLSYIASESSVVPKGRKKLIEKLGWRKLILKGFIERKMKKQVQTMLILNEKEACLMFPRTNGEVDLSEAFWSDRESFREWCLDYFKYSWDTAGTWQENKLKE